MGFFDRFRKKEDAKKLGQKKPRHVAESEANKKAKDKKEEEKKKQFQSVPSAGRTSEGKKDELKDDKKATPDRDKPKPAKAKSGRKPEDLHESHRLLLRPIITEKTGMLGTQRQYVFEVHPRANKPTIYKAIETVYGIKPTRINIINVRGRHVRYGRTTGSTKFWRKAIVTLPEGKSIDLYEA
ncbi:MAG: 50S ribosomal protein L23 [bacterium]